MAKENKRNLGRDFDDEDVIRFRERRKPISEIEGETYD